MPPDPPRVVAQYWAPYSVRNLFPQSRNDPLRPVALESFLIGFLRGGGDSPNLP